MHMINEYRIINSTCRESYFEFLKEFWDIVIPEKPVWNWHMELLCNEVQRMYERIFRNLSKEYDLVANISPGSSKSTIVSVALLPWAWTRMLTFRSLNGSHTHELTLELSRKSRDIVLSEKYQKAFGPISLREDQNTKGHYANTRGGARFCCTIGGKSPIGMHAHAQQVDDPIDPQKAISDVEIETANNWMTETLSTRKIDKSVTPLILIMQRLSQNDPSGYLLSKKNRVVRHLCIPAELTDDVNPPELRKYYSKDGLMDPIRLPRKVLEEYKSDGDFLYSAQFLQTPIPLGGGMFKTGFLIYDDIPPPEYQFKKIVRCWDNAGSPRKNKGDRRRCFTVGAKVGVHKNGSFWILDVIRGRYSVDQRERLKRQTAEADGKHVTIIQEQEGGSGGAESVENTVRNLAGFNIKIDNPKGDKTLRAEPFADQVNGGNVHVIKAEWNSDFVEELKHFPFSTYKDQVDATSAAINSLFKRRRVGAF